MSDPPIFKSPFHTNCELYPRQRPTEFYRTPQPRASCQSQRAEHPRDALNAIRKADQGSPNESTPHRLPRIQPPNNSDMNVVRNSYFS